MNPKSHLLSRSKVEQLLAEGGHYKHAELSADSLAPVYVLNNGSALIVWEDGGRLYETLADLIHLNEMGRRAAADGPINLIDRFFPADQEFAERLPHLLEMLPSLLDVDAAALDRSVRSLEVLDIRLRDRGADYFLRPDVFAAIVAYIGEVICRQVGGSWDVSLGAGSEPWVVDSSGRRYAPFRVVKDLQEYGTEASFAGFVAGIVGSHRLRHG